MKKKTIVVIGATGSQGKGVVNALVNEGSFNVRAITRNPDDLVKSAGFKYSTFVQPPFYYQNLVGMLGPQPKQDGTTGWTLPIDPTKKIIHMADINDLGKVVAGAFLQPEKVGNGNYIPLATELNSFHDIINAFKAHGKEYSFSQVPVEVFSTFFDGAKELAEMFGYFEKHTYMGPDSELQIELGKEIATNKFVTLQEWLGQNN